jgi:hypothetical protein
VPVKKITWPSYFLTGPKVVQEGKEGRAAGGFFPVIFSRFTLNRGIILEAGMQIPIYHIDAFTDTVFGGNPAAVCPLKQWLPGKVMQGIAAENNLSETAFS